VGSNPTPSTIKYRGAPHSSAGRARSWLEQGLTTIRFTIIPTKS